MSSIFDMYVQEGFFSSKPKISEEDKIQTIKDICQDEFEKYKGKDKNLYSSVRVYKHESQYVSALYVCIAPAEAMYASSSLAIILKRYANDLRNALSKLEFKASVNETSENIMIGY